MLKLVQDKLALEASSICVFWMLICNWFRIWFLLQALAIMLQGLQVTSLKIKMVAAKLIPSQHRLTNVKSGPSLLSRVHLTRTRSSRKSGSCAVTAVQKTFSLTPAEVRRIKEADAAKQAECHADHYFSASIRDGISYNTIYLAAILDGHKEEIESIEKAAVELGFGPGVDCTVPPSTTTWHRLSRIDLHNNLVQAARILTTQFRLIVAFNLRQDTKITTNPPGVPSTSRSMIRNLR
ncbi:hypothetical protein K438DRAFT_1780615 [Mycena galopus ATCC 62051]|nr:hypothetical protein K438DRAFT_1780615 [Mycena galopus ATCC 62051]